jgi:Holliday junction resolvase
VKEQTIQAKIIKWLEKHGFYVIKVVAASKNGVPDVVACTPSGKFLAIEVKYGAGTTSPLQDFNLSEIAKRNALAFVAYDVETVIHKVTTAYPELFKGE